MKCLKVISLRDGSPATLAGFQVGDCIIGVGNTIVRTTTELNDALLPSLENIKLRKFAVTLYRGAEKKTLELSRGEHGIFGAEHEIDFVILRKAKYSSIFDGNTSDLQNLLSRHLFREVMVDIDEVNEFVECILAICSRDSLVLDHRGVEIIIPYASVLRARSDHAGLLYIHLHHNIQCRFSF